MVWPRCAWLSPAPIRASTAVRLVGSQACIPASDTSCAQECATTAPRMRCASPPPPPGPPPSAHPRATQVRPAVVFAQPTSPFFCLTRASRVMQASTPPSPTWCSRPSPRCCCSLAWSSLLSSARQEGARRRLRRSRTRRGCCRSGCARNGLLRRRGCRCGSPCPISAGPGGRAGVMATRARAPRCGRLRGRMPRHRQLPPRSAHPARRRRCRRFR